MKRTIWLYNSMFLGILLIVTASCSKKSDTPVITVPVLMTVNVTSITETTAMSGGNITSNGGATVITSGICWSLSANPTISDSKTTDGTGTGNFSSKITGLTTNTLYYVRAYAINSIGTAYGDQKSFTTQQVIIPSFTVRATTVPIQGGTEGLLFYAKCKNDSIKMTKVIITNPTNTQTITYNLNGNNYQKDEEFMLEDPSTAYVKEVGTWQFEFIGIRITNGTSFDVTANLQITKK
jgi:hypothetical protein